MNERSVAKLIVLGLLVLLFFMPIIIFNFIEVDKTEYEEILDMKDDCFQSYSCRKYFKESLENNKLSMYEYAKIKILIKDFYENKEKQTDYKEDNKHLIEALRK